jgi:hypothetical protein
MKEQIKQFVRYQLIKSWVMKYERLLMPVTLLAGVIFDSFTFANIDTREAFILLGIYLSLSGALIIFINGGSASASEIFSGALRDHNLAKLIGEKSFGKGSVQELVELPEGGAVKVTIAKWITPGGKNLNKDGLVPDVEIKLTEQDISAGKDSQMEKALEEITK